MQNPNRNELTNREKEILKHIAEGHSIKEIGVILFLSFYTVDTYRKRILDKLNAKNIANAVKIGIENGFIY